MQRLREFVDSRPRTAAMYGGFCVVSGLVYRNLQPKPNGENDFVLTLSAGLQTMAFAILVCDAGSQVAEGLSEKSLWAFFIAHVARLSTTFWGSGYVPEDNTGDVYLYQSLEAAAVVLLTLKLLRLSTVRTMHDVGQGSEQWSTLSAMVVIAVVLGWFTKSTGHEDYFADWSWMFSVWLDSIALVPQVRLLLTATMRVDEGALHFALNTLAASVAFSAFWLLVAKEHYEGWIKDGYHLFMCGIMAAGLIRVSLCSVYVYMFVKSTDKGGGKGVLGAVLGRPSEYELCAQDDEL